MPGRLDLPAWGPLPCVISSGTISYRGDTTLGLAGGKLEAEVLSVTLTQVADIQIEIHLSLTYWLSQVTRIIGLQITNEQSPVEDYPASTGRSANVLPE
jgi:hypothetical protein